VIVVKNPQKLKADLTNNGNTITSRATQLGYSKAYLSSIVTGVRNPNEKIAIGICELLGEQFETYFFIRNVHKRITNNATRYKLERGKAMNEDKYNKHDIAKKITDLLEGVTYHDWKKISHIIETRYAMIQEESNFSCDKVTLTRINNWF